MMKKPFLVLFCILITLTIAAQQRDLSYYQSAANTNSPEIKENINLQKFSLFQSDLIKAQNQKPQINFTADYLFAPFLFNNGKFMSITGNPDGKAFGYDAALTDGGLYAAQLSVTKSLFNKKTINALLDQNRYENESLKINQTQLQHDLAKSVSDAYISVYQAQQQKDYLKGAIAAIMDRLGILETLVKKDLMKQSDYLQLEIELNSKHFELKQQQSTLLAAISQLNSLCGINDTTVYRFSAPLINRSILVEKYFFEGKYANDSLSILAQQVVSNSKYKPQLNVFGNTGLNSTQASNIPHNLGVTAGFHLNIPIYDGHQKRIIESQNRILLENSRIYRNSYACKIQNELALIDKQIGTEKESLALLEMQLSKMQTLINIYESKLSIGQISVMEYIVALQDYSQAVQNKLQLETNMWLLINQYNYLNW
ncbi:MAG: TolC family protein [Bacteroidales bacterium]|nr:TolC family protein [Bacteroidales bacterium]